MGSCECTPTPHFASLPDFIGLDRVVSFRNWLGCPGIPVDELSTSVLLVHRSSGSDLCEGMHQLDEGWMEVESQPPEFEVESEYSGLQQPSVEACVCTDCEPHFDHSTFPSFSISFSSLLFTSPNSRTLNSLLASRSSSAACFRLAIKLDSR